MRAARARADGDAVHLIERLEEEVAILLGAEKLANAPDLGGGFRGYRVGNGSIYAALPLRQGKLAIAASGMLVVATNFGDVHHVQRAPQSMRQARLVEPYIAAMRGALERHLEGCGAKEAKFGEVSDRVARILAALAV